MKWIQASERLPEKSTHDLSKDKAIIFQNRKRTAIMYVFLSVVPNIAALLQNDLKGWEWLDESASLPSSSVTGESEAIGERKFTLKEMRDAFCCPYNAGKTHIGSNRNKDEKQYFKQTFGIDI